MGHTLSLVLINSPLLSILSLGQVVFPACCQQVYIDMHQARSCLLLMFHEYCYLFIVTYVAKYSEAEEHLLRYTT